MAKSKTLVFKGKTHKFTNIETLAKKLQVPVSKLREIRDIGGSNVVKEISVLGETFKFKDTKKAAKRIGISQKSIVDIVKGKTKKIAIANGVPRRFDIRDKPLFLKKFGVKIDKLKPTSITRNRMIKGVEIVDFVPGNMKVSVALSITFRISISKDIGKIRHHTETVNIAPQNINEDTFDRLFKKVIRNYPDGTDAVLVDTKILSSFDKDTEFKIKNKKLLSSKHLDISNHFNEVVEHSDKEYKYNCVVDHLLDLHKGMDKNIILSLGDENGVSIDELNEHCEVLNIKLVVYDISGNVICEHIPNKKSKSKAVIGVSYNNHFYPLRNQYLNKSNGACKNVALIDNGLKELLRFIKKGILPKSIKMGDYIDKQIDIVSFIVDKTKYICNDEYEQCKEILKRFGLSDKIYDGINLTGIGVIIEKLYIKTNVESFFPTHDRFVKGGYTYNNDSFLDIEHENVETIDKNNCYPYCLKELPYLIHFDYRKSELHKKDDLPRDLVGHYLYIVKPEMSSILMPDCNIYTGEHVIFCEKQGLRFEIIECMETEKSENYYTTMVDDIFDKLPRSEGKSIMNRHIGKFECQAQYRCRYVLDTIGNEDEVQSNDSHIKCKLCKGVYARIVEQDLFSLYTKKPISVQVKDASRRLLYDKMIEMNINEDDVIQIKTDSITYNKRDDQEELEIDDSQNRIDCWKKELYNKMTSHKEYSNEVLTFIVEPEKRIYDDRVMVQAYAGSGKTHSIINDLIPRFGKNYIVLTSNHSTLKEYRKLELNCCVIQTYIFNNSLPDKERIIVDEHGLNGREANDIIYKCYLKGKKIYSYGDWNQLLPVKDVHYNSKQYIYMLYSKTETMTSNYRNNFTQKYYDKLINTNDTSYLISQVTKYSIKYTDADVILCYRNDTVDKYNKLMLEYLGLKDPYNIDVKLICKTNKLSQYDIYNNFEFTITDVNDDGIELNNEYTFTREIIKSNFKLGYARTIYNIQGSSIESYHFPDDDQKFIGNRSAYTIISRIKEKIEEKKKRKPFLNDALLDIIGCGMTFQIE